MSSNILTRCMLMAFMLVFITAGMAFAGVGGGDVPTVPGTVSVGQTLVPFDFTISNNSTTPNDVNTVTVTNIYFTPACGSSLTPAVPCGTPDIAVFSMSATGTGRAGTACAGTVFIIGPGSVPGEFEFTPGAPVVLGDSQTGGAAATCTVDFTVNVLSLPNNDSSASPGLQTSQLARADTLTDDETAETGAAAGSSTLTFIIVQVQRVVPTMNEWGMILFVILAGIGSVYYLRRRRIES